MFADVHKLFYEMDVGHKDLSSFTELLKAELEERISRNEQYSLRAFARDLELEPSMLSKFLRRERTLSAKSIEKIGRALELPPSVVQAYKIKTRLERFTRRQVRSAEKQEFHQFSLNEFEKISDWYHMAILELTFLKSFKSDTSWIAKKLSIEPSTVEAAVERLIGLGLLVRESDGQLKACQTQNSTTGMKFTAEALKSMQKQALELAEKALRDVDFGRRSQSTLTFAVCEDMLPLIQEKITKFRRQINKLAMSKKNKNAVYNLTIALYPVTEPED